MADRGARPLAMLGPGDQAQPLRPNRSRCEHRWDQGFGWVNTKPGFGRVPAHAGRQINRPSLAQVGSAHLGIAEQRLGVATHGDQP